MITIQDIVNSKVSDMIANGTIESAIAFGVQKAIESAINNQFERYGAIAKQIDEAISNGLILNTEDLPFETYNQQMLVAVKGKLGAMFQGAASERFMAEIEKTLAPAPAQISLEELVETIVKFWREDDSNIDNLGDYARVETRPFYEYGITLSMWKNKSQHTGSDLELYITNGTIRINHRHHYNPTCFSDYEAFIFKCYAAGTVITGIEDFDADDCDLSLRDYED